MVYTELHHACDHSQWSLVRTLIADDPATVLELGQFGRLYVHAGEWICGRRTEIYGSI